MAQRSDALVREYERRRSRAVMLNTGVGLLIAGAYIVCSRNFDNVFQGSWVIMGAWAGAGLAMTILGAGSALSWVLLWKIVRCPACNRYGGASFQPNFCPHCGVPLR